MTYDLLKLAEECALFFNTNRSESAKRTMRAVATALREAHAEISRLRAELEARPRWMKYGNIDDIESGVKTCGIVQSVVSGEYTTRSRGCDTPLDAIEAATKEESNGNG